MQLYVCWYVSVCISKVIGVKKKYLVITAEIVCAS